MEIKSHIHEREQQVRYKIIGSRHTKSYRTIDDLVLKVFLDNNYLEQVLSTHENDFLDYLKYLSSIKCSTFETPEIVYTTDESFVRSYVRKFILGTSLGGLYPKTSIEPVITVIEKLYMSLREHPEISLDGVTAKDMIHTGETIVLTDFDLCRFNGEDNYVNNLKLLDKAIFIGLFKIKPEDIQEFNEDYIDLVKRLEDEDYHITDYLKEYSSDLKKKHINPKYLRTLENNLILK